MAIWLKDASGIRVPLVGGSLLVGRSPTCHVVLASPRVSRQQVLIVELEGGAQVVPLGRAPTLLRGAPLEGPTVARHGDVLDIDGATFQLEIATPAAPSAWLIQAGQRSYPVRASGFRAGGAETDDIRLPEWPDGAVVFYPAGPSLLAEIHHDVAVSGATTDGELVLLPAGSTLDHRGLSITVVLATDAPATADLGGLPTDLSVELMPNGALFKLRISREYSVWLPRKRGDLVAALLSPPGGLKAGDWVPDELLIPRVWGGESASREQLNTLIHRTRLTLAAAGLPGAAIIERAPGGKSTRAQIARGARASVS